VIIVEGFDCSGKSTLALKIALALKIPVLHPGGPTRDESDVVACLLRSLSRMKQRCVQDRVTHISESVYSMLPRPKHAVLALNSIREVAHAELIIYCRPPTEFLLQALVGNHKVKEHDDIEKLGMAMQEAPTLIRLYDTVMHLVAMYAGCRVITYDRAKIGDQEHIMEIVKRKFA
jgi:adenylate kinase family enzyme